MSDTRQALEEALYAMWDDLSLAIDKVLTALPGQMTAASQELEARRREYHTSLYKLGRYDTIAQAALRAKEAGDV